jgi:hypothetical protein
MQRTLNRWIAVLGLLASLAAFSANGAVIDANGHAATPPGHPGAIFDTETLLLWLDATETVNRSLADVQSELGEGGEFAGFRLATRTEIHELFVNAGLEITNPPGGFVADADLQSRVQAFVGIYGQTQTSPPLLGTDVWHANTFDAPGVYGLESASWVATDTRAWVGDNGVSSQIAGTAGPARGVALVRALGADIGNPLVDADDSFSNPGEIIFDATTARITTTGAVASWSFFDNDDLDPNGVITPMILRYVTGDEYEITGIGAPRASTETGIQTYPFELQSGSDQVVADGSYYFGFRSANPDGSLNHGGGVDATFGTGSTSYFNARNDSPSPVGSVIPFFSFAATYSYAALISLVPEPDALLLGAAAVAALAATGRSRRRRRSGS